MSVDETIQQSIEEPRTAVLFVIVALATAFMFVLVLALTGRPTRERIIVGVSEKYSSADCLSPRQIVGTSEAVLMKRRLGPHALLVDVRSPGERGPHLSIESDVNAPFMESYGASGMQFRIDFGDRVDTALRAARMTHDEPVIIMAPAIDRGVLAALMLQERGYSGVLVMYDWSRAGSDPEASSPDSTGATRVPLAAMGGSRIRPE
jgi:hypothetical protein